MQNSSVHGASVLYVEQSGHSEPLTASDNDWRQSTQGHISDKYGRAAWCRHLLTRTQILVYIIVSLYLCKEHTLCLFVVRSVSDWHNLCHDAS